MTTGVVVMAYGSPLGPDDLAAYYTDVRRGRPPSDEQLMELRSRYEAIGGVSPLVERTTAQIRAIGHALDVAAPGEFRTFYGTKHSTPTIERAVLDAVESGVSSIVGVVLAPHYASRSVGEYIERAERAATGAGVEARFVERYGSDPALISLLADRVAVALEPFADDPDGTEVVFTAHSLPLRSLRPEDDYGDQIAETARLVASELDLAHFRTGWQSAGMTGDTWLGPDLLVTLEELAAQGTRNIVVCPCGFTSDHLEVLYDLDIVATARCRELGVRFARTASLNDDPRFAALVAALIVRA
jgi:ferrochelatase